MLMNTNDASKENVYASICKKAREENAKQRVSIDTQKLPNAALKKNKNFLLKITASSLPYLLVNFLKIKHGSILLLDLAKKMLPMVENLKSPFRE